MSGLISIVLTILIFGLVVLIHEGGHFLMARKNGIFVEEFAIGMGPALLKKQKGDTLYSVRAFPIGGYCKMLGEDADSTDSRAFGNKSVKARMQVILAGVFMNFILGFLIFLFIMSVEGFFVPTVATVTEGYPAQQAGLMPGDKIVELNGSSISSYNQFIFNIGRIEPTDVNLVVDRNGEKIDMNLDLFYNEEESRYMLGFSPEYRIGLLESKDDAKEITDSYTANGLVAPIKAGFFETISQTFKFIWFYIYATFATLAGLFTGATGLSSMSGPIGIAGTVGTEYTKAAAVSGWAAFESMLSITGTISLALAIFNILPLPALDGGRLVFLIIEGVRGKPVDPDKEGLVHFVGFVVLMLFAVVVAFSDVFKMM